MAAPTTLLEARIRADLTQEQLAALAGVSKFTIQQAEAGARLRPLTQQKIARALGFQDRRDVFPEPQPEAATA